MIAGTIIIIGAAILSGMIVAAGELKNHAACKPALDPKIERRIRLAIMRQLSKDCAWDVRGLKHKRD